MLSMMMVYLRYLFTYNNRIICLYEYEYLNQLHHCQYTIICCLNLSYVTTQDYHQKRDHLALLCVLSTIYLAYVSTVVAKGCYYHATVILKEKSSRRCRDRASC